MLQGPDLIVLCAVWNYFSQNGMTLQVSGREMHIRGTVLLTLADTLATHQLGGFKIGVGFALRKCRVCVATWEDIQTKVHQYLVYMVTNELAKPASALDKPTIVCK